jgi:hypothetical protein
MNPHLIGTHPRGHAACRALAALCLLATNSFGEFRDVVTHDQLLKKRTQMTQQDPMKQMEVSKTPEDSSQSLQRDLINESDFLSFGGISTLVPKQSIILTPQNLAARLTYVKGNPLVNWIEFYTKNRGWITTVEISFAQAKGEQALPDSVTQMITKSGNLVIATFSGGPISMLPAKAPTISR